MVVDRQYRHTRTAATRGDALAPGLVTGLDVERAQVLPTDSIFSQPCLIQ